MAEVARGQLSDRPFVRTLYTVAAKRFSGDLRVESGGATCALAWHRGLVVAADVPGADGSLLDRATAMVALDDGAFTLDDQSAVEASPDDEPADARRVIFHGLLTRYDAARLQRELAPLARRRFQIAPDAVASIDAYGFADDDQPLIKALLERRWTLDELAQQHPDIDRQRIGAVVYALLATDAMTLDDANARAPAPRAPAPRAPVPRAPVPNARTPAAAPRPQRTTVPPDDAVQLRRIVSERVQLLSSKADHFAMLGVARDASGADIRAAYFELAKLLHPDRIRQLKLAELAKPASQVFARINEAFGVLGDDANRRAYLAELADGGARAAPEQPMSQAKMRAILEAEEKFQLGEMALRRSHFSQAVEDFGRAVELNPDEGEHHAMHAWARWMDARDKAAVRDEVRKQFRTGIRLAPNNPNVYYWRGRLAADLDDEQGALYCYEKALALEPKHELAFRQRNIIQNAIAAREKSRGKRAR